MSQPYVSNPENGESKTREFLELFLDSYSGPASDGNGRNIASIYDSIFGKMPSTQEPLYQNKSKDRIKRYIGRASKVMSSENPDEGTWCVIADIRSALQQLDDRSRIVLGLRYIRDYSDETISEAIGVSTRTVQRIVAAALTNAANILDRAS